ncbi:MAG: transporter, partial [Muribaculaceae bacterium]
MNFAKIRQSIKPWMLPIAMLGGILFHDFIDKIQFLSPYLIFVMLLITYCRVRPKEFKVTSLSWGLLSVQIGAAIASYLLLAPVNIDLAQGTMI